MGDQVTLMLWLVGVPGLVALGIWMEHRRRQRVMTWAVAIGWTYVGSDRSLVDRWQGRPFGVGHSKRVSELVTGTFQGRRAMSFRYRYTTGSGKNQSTITHHVLVLSLPAYLPTLELTPEGLGAKLAKAFGGQDIRFESEDFNRSWRVEAFEPKFASDVVHPRLMERLMRDDAGGLSLRIEGTDMLCWTLGGPRLEAVAPRLQVMCAVVDAIPRFVWIDHGYDPASTAPQEGTP